MFTLSKPQGEGPIAPAVLGYVARKLRNDFYDLVLKEFQSSGMSQTALAERAGIDTGQLSRQLSTPGNWTIDTVAKLLFAISGRVVETTATDVDARAPGNLTRPVWLDAEAASVGIQRVIRLNPPSPERPTTTSAPRTEVKIESKTIGMGTDHG